MMPKQGDGMKVVVANPPWPGEGYGARTNIRWPHRRPDKHLAYPIYLAYASSILKKNNFQVYALDAVEREQGIFTFVKDLKSFDPKIVLLEISTPSLNYDLETAQLVKSEIPDALVVVCGAHADYFYNDLLKSYSFIDACIRGEYEITLLALCEAIRDGKPLETVEGIAFRGKKQEVTVNKDRPFYENIDDLPYPDWESFQMEKYQKGFFGGKKTATIISSRGCPHLCTFCVWPQTTGGRLFRPRSPRNVVDEMAYLKENYGVDEYFFDDDTLTLDKERNKALCREIIARNINLPWHCMGRVNNVDEDVLKLMRQAGCTQIFYGFESGSDEILKSVKKGINTAQIMKGVRLTQKAGIAATGSFMFGNIKDSPETVKKTIDFAKKLRADFVQFTLAAPFPGTEFYEQAKAQGFLELESWSDLDGTKGPIARTEYFSRQDLPKLVRKAYLNYYTSPRIIWQNLKMMRSMNDFRRITRGALSVMARVVYFKN